MTTEKTSIPVPVALRELINSNNILLANYQQELTKKVVEANDQMMEMLGISVEDGWSLDTQTMTYVKKDPPKFEDLPVKVVK